MSQSVGATPSPGLGRSGSRRSDSRQAEGAKREYQGVLQGLPPSGSPPLPPGGPGRWAGWGLLIPDTCQHPHGHSPSRRLPQFWHIYSLQPHLVSCPFRVHWRPKGGQVQEVFLDEGCRRAA